MLLCVVCLMWCSVFDVCCVCSVFDVCVVLCVVCKRGPLRPGLYGALCVVCLMRV